MSPQDQSLFDRYRAWKHRPKSYGLESEDVARPQEIYADLMKFVFAPALRSEGLKGSNGRFELPSATHWAQLGFQKSAYSDGQEVRFTVNLSVIDREIWDQQRAARTYYPAKPSPSTHFGDFQDEVRLGQLATGGEDLWWSVVQGMDPAPVGDEVRDALVTLGVPWLVARAGR